MNITNNKKELIIKIPLTQKTYCPYGGPDGECDNIIGIIEPDPQCSDPKLGFCYQIDMSYKGKPNQWSDFFLMYNGQKEEFIKLCEKLQIETFEYEACVKCGKALFGTFTYDNGPCCFDCDNN